MIDYRALVTGIGKMAKTATEQIVGKLRKKAVLRSRDLSAGSGVYRTHLQRLEQQGVIERAGRGLYRLAGVELTEYESYLAAAQLVPQGVICLLSALRFHDLTTQNPFEIWMAIENKSHPPKSETAPLRIHYFSGAAFTEGVEEHKISGVTVRVYSVAKTVADCFKFRNKIGLDVALEALRECRRERRATADEIWRYAEVCRVKNVMRPYLEAVW